MSGETAKDESGWTIDTAIRFFQSQIDALCTQVDIRESALIRNLDERYVALVRNLDERYIAQTKAVDAAFEAQQSAMFSNLVAQKEAVTASLAAAETAVNKAEIATEKRFDSVNEFRAQLADQARTFISRTESLSRHDRTAEQINHLDKAMNEFRDRVAIQAATFMPRAESETRIAVNSEKIASMESRFTSDLQRLGETTQGTLNRFNNSLNEAYTRLSAEHNEAMSRLANRTNEQFAEVNSRLDRAAGSSSLDGNFRQDIADLRRAQYEAAGQKTQVVEARANNNALYATIGFAVTLILAAITIVGFVVGAG